MFVATIASIDITYHATRMISRILWSVKHSNLAACPVPLRTPKHGISMIPTWNDRPTEADRVFHRITDFLVRVILSHWVDQT